MLWLAFAVTWGAGVIFFPRGFVLTVVAFRRVPQPGRQSLMRFGLFRNAIMVIFFVATVVYVTYALITGQV